MPTPLHMLKADFFKTLGHPLRVRALEILSQGEHSVAEILAQVEVEASSLSQQLAVLRRSGVVRSRREGSTVYYSLTSPQVAELLAVARSILAQVLTGQEGLLVDLRAEGAPARPPSRRRRTG